MTSMSTSKSSSALAMIAVVRFRERRGDVRSDLVCGPVDQREGALCALDVDVRDGDDVDAGDVVGLGQVHGAVAAGADEADPDGTAFLLAVAQEFVKVHWGSLWW